MPRVQTSLRNEYDLRKISSDGCGRDASIWSPQMSLTAQRHSGVAFSIPQYNNMVNYLKKLLRKREVDLKYHDYGFDKITYFCWAVVGGGIMLIIIYGLWKT